ncbi:MAG: PIG-L family deacetylase, partial [candidate division Zixibacteria bacterium]|nr:PIG-L family deacetylase [candidate division Zixibacteria bacterium]
MSNPLHILSIGAHPADIFDQSGGTMAHHVAAGDRVSCIVMTHGARVHDKVISDQMFHAEQVPEAGTLTALMQERSDVKAQEVRTACRHLGVEEVYFMGVDDAILLPDREVVRQLARMLRSLRPDVILTHFPEEGGGIWNPHAVAGQMVMLALGYAGSVDPGDRNPPMHVMQIFYWGTGAAAIPRSVWDARGGYYNDVFIDITDVVDKKLAALDALESQGYGGTYARKRIETSDGAFGGAGGVPYAEGFIKLSAETHYYLPIADSARQGKRESDHERMARY